LTLHSPIIEPDDIRSLDASLRESGVWTEEAVRDEGGCGLQLNFKDTVPYEDVQLDMQVRLVSLPEWKLAGLPVTCAFADAVADRIAPVKREFYRRTEELGEMRSVFYRSQLASGARS
jgi:hypothetical protein